MKRNHLVKTLPLLAAALLLTSPASALAAELDPVQSTEDIASEDVGEAGASRETTVTYQKGTSFTVTIPKSIALSTEKSADYAVTVKGSIEGGTNVTVSPKDDMADRDGVNFEMTDAKGKSPVAADVTQADTVWSEAEVTEAGTAKNGSILAEGLSAGEWSGILTFEIQAGQA